LYLIPRNESFDAQERKNNWLPRFTDSVEGAEKSDLDNIIEKKASRIDTNGDFLFNQ
jgi:hypothetical protein